jgi:hypothetical protein
LLLRATNACYRHLSLAVATIAFIACGSQHRQMVDELHFRVA